MSVCESERGGVGSGGGTIFVFLCPDTPRVEYSHILQREGGERNSADLFSIPWSPPSVSHTTAFVPVI